MFPLNWSIPFIRKNGSRTNLGNILGDVEKKRVLVDIENVTVNADGVKTYKELLNAVYTAYKNAITSGDPDNNYLAVALRVSSSYLAVSNSIPMRTIYVPKSPPSGVISFSTTLLNTSQERNRTLYTYITSDGSNTVYTQTDITSDGYTFTNLSDTVPGSGTVIALYYKVYKTVG